MKAFDCNLPVKIIFGPGKLSHIGDIASDYGNKAFLVLDPYLKDCGVYDDVASHLRKANIDFNLFTDIQPNPICHEIDKGAKLAEEAGCDFIIGIGGGSTMDTAKAIAILCRNPGSSWNYIERTDREVLRPKEVLPVVAIPTTAGTGSEVTFYSVISNPDVKEKGCIANVAIFPVVALIDPELMATMPSNLTAFTGIDALSHSLESFINIHATPFSDLIARESICIIARYLPEAVANGSNIFARSKIAWASALGGIAISHAGTCLPHALGQPVSGLVGAPHGGSISACLQKVIEFSYTSDLQKFAELAEAFDPSIRDLPLRIRAEKSAELTNRLLKDINCRVRFSDFGMEEAHIEKAIDIAVHGYAFDLGNHPKSVTKEDLSKLYKACL